MSLAGLFPEKITVREINEDEDLRTDEHIDDPKYLGNEYKFMLRTAIAEENTSASLSTILQKPRENVLASYTASLIDG